MDKKNVDKLTDSTYPKQMIAFIWTLTLIASSVLIYLKLNLESLGHKFLYLFK